ncbi:MAG: hypothetical protein OXU20_02340 [Myxococcales bacterium]|nr:hypothetical protein [Myxococcales bacterium]MDD9971794.1 hypothetical protein [Myxococcales bacterium]
MSSFPPPADGSSVSTPPLDPRATVPLPLILWKNIFVVVDDGNVSASDYEESSRRVLAQALRYPDGIGGLTVIPQSGRPPSEAGRQAIKRAYESVTPHLRSVCWLVEGQGFRAATARAALAGLRLLLRPPFPTKVFADLNDAVPWLSQQLGTRSVGTVAEGVTHIRSQLNELEARHQSVRPFP